MVSRPESNRRMIGRRLLFLTMCLLGLFGCGYILSYVIVALIRMHYPFELQWIEGASLIEVQRINAGKEIYTSPSIHYIPMIYPPLYFYTSALIAKILGSGFFPLRLLSFLSSLGCIGFIYAFIRKEGYNRWIAVSSGGLYAGCYSLTTGWFDVARVDSFFLLLALGGLYALRKAESPLSLATAGVLAWLAFLAKQSGFVIAAPMIIYTMCAYRKKSAWFIAPYLGLIAISIIFLNHSTHSWYAYYVFKLPSQHTIETAKLLEFWTKDLFPGLFVAIAFAFLYLLIGINRSKSKEKIFYVCATLGMISTAWTGRLHSGGYVNVVMPAYAWISVLFGIGVGSLLERARSAELTLAIYLACFLQYACLVYSPGKYIPDEKDYRSGYKLVSLVSNVKGEVLIPFHPYIAVLAGKKPSFHRMVFSDICRSNDAKIKCQLNREINTAINSKKYKLIILDDLWLRDQVLKEYTSRGTVFSKLSDFKTRSGLPKRPRRMYIPKKDIKDWQAIVHSLTFN